MPLPTELVNEFDDVDTSTNDDQNDDTNDVDDTTSDDQNEDSKDTDNDADSDNSGEDDKDEPTDEDDKNELSDDDEGYFADEDDSGDEEDKPADLPAVPANFTAEEKYIIDNLPKITVRVRLADDSIKTMEVRSAADLPRDMKGIATPYEDKQFDLANSAQETRARELQTYYRQHQSQLQAQEFEKAENQAIRDDIAELQRDGEIPKFKAQPGTRAFESDPAAKTVQEVIEFMNERNAKYLDATNKRGAAFRRIGFADAFELMNAGVKSNPKNSSTRKDAASKLRSKQGGSTAKKTKAAVSGRTLKEVAAEFDDFEG